MRTMLLRWTWRDLRARWLQVLATAIVLAVGVGAFAGLGGLTDWRKRSADASRDALAAQDVRVDLADGAFVPRGDLDAAVRALPRGDVAAAQERLVTASQVDASRRGSPVVVPAKVIGIPGLGRTGPERVAVLDGRRPADGRGVVLNWNFAQYYDLPAAGTLRLAGVGDVRYTGLGVTPQTFLIVDETAISGAESGLATLYAPLAVAQQAAGKPGQVNQLLVRGAPGTDQARLARDVSAALRRALPGVGFTTALGDDEPVTRIMYRDADNDQKLYTAFAIMLLAGAGLAAFNLVSRVVEAQRREIGVGMALGAEPRLLALRPLVFGLQIGLLGALLAVPLGVGLAELIKDLFREYLPLPEYVAAFPWGRFVVGWLIGVLVPLAAAALPVWRAVRVAPVDAIRTGHRTASGAGAAGALRRLRLPGRPLTQLPLRNLARTPRRTVMTIVGLGAVITATVAMLSMVDAITDLADRREAELLRSTPDRLAVTLTDLAPADGPAVRRVAAAPGVAEAVPGLTVGAQVADDDTRLDGALTLVDPDDPVWHPTMEQGRLAPGGVALAEKAADDLGVSVGDTVRLTHPARRGAGVALATTPMRVAAIHADPIRAVMYADAADAPKLGLAGVASTVTVVPDPAAPAGTVERALFGAPGVASVRPVRAEAETLRTTVETFGGAIRIVGVITLGLAVLVAFTSTSVSVDERRREYATMFAAGLPPRTGLRVATVESVVCGVLGVGVGIGIGFLVAGWVVHVLLPDSFPELSARTVLTAGSLLTTLLVGILATALAPLLTFRRMRRMDLPATLRVVE